MVIEERINLTIFPSSISTSYKPGCAQTSETNTEIRPIMLLQIPVGTDIIGMAVVNRAIPPNAVEMAVSSSPVVRPSFSSVKAIIV